MKSLSNLRNRMRANLLQNNRGQGATEYILLLVVVVGLVVSFGPKIKEIVQGKTKTVAEGMDKITVE